MSQEVNNYDVTEAVETYEGEIVEYDGSTEVSNGGNGKVVGLILGVATAGAAIGATVYGAIKKRKNNKTKKTKKKLMWVEVPVDDAEVVDEEDVEVVDDKKSK